MHLGQGGGGRGVAGTAGGGDTEVRVAQGHTLQGQPSLSKICV